MAYEAKLNWADGMSVEAPDMIRIEQGVKDAHDLLEGGAAGLDRMQNTNLAKALAKLRQGVQTEFAFIGDSIFYAFDYTNATGDAIAEDCVPHNGSPLTGYKRCSVTIYDSFADAMNIVHEDKVRIKKMVYTGDCLWTAYHRWNPSKSDVAFVLFGVNDSVGSHITTGYHPDLPDGYRGNIDLFQQAIRRFVEREIRNGTAVVLMTPTVQTLRIEGVDTDGRILIDAYAEATKEVAKEYNIPVIDGYEMTKNFGNDMMIDFTHFTKDGFRNIGYRMASYFTGKSPLYPMPVYGGSYLGTHPIMDNVNIATPTVLDSNEKSPNIPVVLRSDDLYVDIDRITGGLQANVSGKGSITWSFYCPYDGMVVVPSFYTENETTALIKLDFGAKQGKWNNYWSYVSTDGVIDRNHAESSTIEIGTALMTTSGIGKVYSLHTVTDASKPVIKITSRGWHSITFSIKPIDKVPQVQGIIPMSDIPEDFGDGVFNVYGLNFLTLDEYKRKINAQ
ncbi:MAG: SGNH/GDSL hydrolase family protein [Cellulosilyticaceae bacterium]